jgi:anti-anti-sigma regulatory factor
MTVIEFVSGEIVGREQAEALRVELDSLVWPGYPDNLLIDFANVRLMGSAAFEVIGSFARQLGRVKVCCVGEGLRVGAGLVGLDDCVDYFDSRESAESAAIEAAQRAGADTADYVVMPV